MSRKTSNANSKPPEFEMEAAPYDPTYRNKARPYFAGAQNNEAPTETPLLMGNRTTSGNATTSGSATIKEYMWSFCQNLGLVFKHYFEVLKRKAGEFSDQASPQQKCLCIGSVIVWFLIVWILLSSF